MKNFVGGIIAAIFGTWILANTTMPNLSTDLIESVLHGAHSLSMTLSDTADQTVTVWRLTSWGLMGFIEGLFSRRGWNTVRTACWAGVAVTFLSLVSVLVSDPQFWNAPDRNVIIMMLFILTIPIALISLVVSVPVASLVEQLRSKQEPPYPTKIETTCSCGASFKSVPCICSECGRTLNAHENDK